MLWRTEITGNPVHSTAQNIHHNPSRELTLNRCHLQDDRDKDLVQCCYRR